MWCSGAGERRRGSSAGEGRGAVELGSGVSAARGGLKPGLKGQNQLVAQAAVLPSCFELC